MAWQQEMTDKAAQARTGEEAKVIKLFTLPRHRFPALASALTFSGGGGSRPSFHLRITSGDHAESYAKGPDLWAWSFRRWRAELL